MLMLTKFCHLYTPSVTLPGINCSFGLMEVACTNLRLALNLIT